MNTFIENTLEHLKNLIKNPQRALDEDCGYNFTFAIKALTFWTILGVLLRQLTSSFSSYLLKFEIAYIIGLALAITALCYLSKYLFTTSYFKQDSTPIISKLPLFILDIAILVSVANTLLGLLRPLTSQIPFLQHLDFFLIFGLISLAFYKRSILIEEKKFLQFALILAVVFKIVTYNVVASASRTPSVSPIINVEINKIIEKYPHKKSLMVWKDKYLAELKNSLVDSESLAKDIQSGKSEYLDILSCIFSLTENGDGREITNNAILVVFNTPEKIEKYLEFQQKLGGHTYAASERITKESCLYE